MTTLTEKKLLLVAGFGSIAIELVEAAKANGREVIVFSFDKDNSRELKKMGIEVYDYAVFEIQQMIDKGLALGIKELTFIGKIPKSTFFKNLHKLNKEFLEEVWKLRDLSDDSLHLKIAEKIEGTYGGKIIDQSLYIKHLFPGKAIYTEIKPSAEDLNEIEFGLKMAKANAALDIGQTVITRNKSVIAVEAIEGTNKCISRAKKLIGIFDRNKKIYVSKVSKPNQDKRFDIPTIGLETIKAMPKGSYLAFEANETFFIDQEDSIKLANRKNICIAAFDISAY
jgi:UDP-2,3-diacylglucosamine hydrolase